MENIYDGKPDLNILEDFQFLRKIFLSLLAARTALRHGVTQDRRG